MVVSTVWFKNFLVGPEVGLGLPALVPALGVFSLGLLMVSPVPYHSGKNLRFGQSYSTTVIMLIVLLLLILEPGLNFFLVGVAYVIAGPAGMLWRWKTGRELIPAEDNGPPGAEAESLNVTPITDHLQPEDPPRAGTSRGGETA